MREQPSTPQHKDTVVVRLPQGDRVSRRFRLLVGAIVCVAVMPHLPSLRWGFLYDDYIHQFMLRRAETDGPAKPWNLYDFGMRPGPGDSLYEWGFFPWWTDPDFKIRFFRPITSLSIIADHLVYGDWAPGYHLTGLILFAILLLLVFRLYRLLGVPETAAIWAFIIFAISDIHVVPVGWIANRNALLATLFLVAMLLALHSYQTRPKPAKLAITVACFLMACGSKESGIIGLPLVALHEFLYTRNPAGGSLKERLRLTLRSRPLQAITLVTIVYVAWYATAGYGTQSLLYPAPWRTPGQYLTRLATLLPLSGASLIFGIPSDLAATVPAAMHRILIFSAVALPVAGWIMARTIRWTPAAWFSLGLIALSFVPEAGADPSDRLLLNASVGMSLLTGLFLDHVGGWRTALAQRRIAQLSLCAVLLFRCLLLSVPSALARGSYFSRMGSFDRQSIALADIDRDRPEPRHVLVLNSPSSLLATTQLATWAVIHDDPGTRIHLGQMGRRGLLWHRQDDRRMTLTSLGAPFSDQRFERLFCTGRPLEPDAVHYRTSAFAAIPLDVEATGARRVLLEFDHSLDDDMYQFIQWQDGRFVRTSPPRIGETREIPEIPSPFPVVP